MKFRPFVHIKDCWVRHIYEKVCMMWEPVKCLWAGWHRISFRKLHSMLLSDSTAVFWICRVARCLTGGTKASASASREQTKRWDQQIGSGTIWAHKWERLKVKSFRTPNSNGGSTEISLPGFRVKLECEQTFQLFLKSLLLYPDCLLYKYCLKV